MDPELDREFRQLCQAFLALETEEECTALLKDLCTIKEIENMGQRLETAKMLKDGKRYNEVMEKSGVSSATISRVNKCLNYGTGGYRLVLDRMEEKED